MGYHNIHTLLNWNTVTIDINPYLSTNIDDNNRHWYINIDNKQKSIIFVPTATDYYR
jgi:hypothetical protein